MSRYTIELPKVGDTVTCVERGDKFLIIKEFVKYDESGQAVWLYRAVGLNYGFNLLDAQGDTIQELLDDIEGIEEVELMWNGKLNKEEAK